MGARNSEMPHKSQLLLAFRFFNPFPATEIPHGAPLGRRTRPAAAHAAPEVPW